MALVIMLFLEEDEAFSGCVESRTNSFNPVGFLVFLDAARFCVPICCCFYLATRWTQKTVNHNREAKTKSNTFLKTFLHQQST